MGRSMTYAMTHGVFSHVCDQVKHFICLSMNVATVICRCLNHDRIIIEPSVVIWLTRGYDRMTNKT